MGGCGGLKELIFNCCHLGKMCYILHNLFWVNFSLVGCGILKGLILDIFHFGSCGLERSDFGQFLSLGDVVVLKGLLFVIFLFGRV